MRNSTKYYIKIAVLTFLYLVGIAVIVLLVKKVGLNTFINAIKTVNIKIAIFAVVIFIMSNILRGTKLYIFYKIHYNEVKYPYLLSVYFASNALNNIIPGRSGDLFSLFILKKSQNYSVNKIGSILFLDRVIEIFFMAIFLIISILYLFAEGSKQNINILVCTLVVLLTLIITGVTTAVMSRSIIRKIFSLKISNIISDNLKKRIIEFTDKFFYSCAKALEYRKTGYIFCLTAICWLLDFTALFSGINSMTQIKLVHSIIAQAVSIPISALSFIPNGLGVSSLSYLGITEILGYNTQKIISASVFSKVLFLITIYFLGLTGTFNLSRRKKGKA